MTVPIEERELRCPYCTASFDSSVVSRNSRLPFLQQHIIANHMKQALVDAFGANNDA